MIEQKYHKDEKKPRGLSLKNMIRDYEKGKGSMEAIVAEGTHGLTVEEYRRKYPLKVRDGEIRFWKKLVGDAQDFARKEKEHINIDIHSDEAGYNGKPATRYSIATIANMMDTILQFSKEFGKAKRGLTRVVSDMSDLCEVGKIPVWMAVNIGEVRGLVRMLLALEPFNPQQKLPFIEMKGEVHELRD